MKGLTDRFIVERNMVVTCSSLGAQVIHKTSQQCQNVKDDDCTFNTVF